MSFQINLVWNFFNFNALFSLETDYLISWMGILPILYLFTSYLFSLLMFFNKWSHQYTTGRREDWVWRESWNAIYICEFLFLNSLFVKYINKWEFFSVPFILVFNCTLWLPQIVQNFVLRKRKGPNPALALSMQIIQGTLPVYFKLAQSSGI